MLALFLSLCLSDAGGPPGYVIVASPANDRCSVQIGPADTRPGDVVQWDLPPQVSHALSDDKTAATLWVDAYDVNERRLWFEVGTFRGSHTLYRAGSPPRRVEFVLIVR